MAISEAAVLRLRGEAAADVEFDASDESFATFYRRFYPRLFALCRRRVSQDALAEDIAQETLVRALANVDAFDPTRPAWPWLKTIATNLIVDHFRKELREASLAPEQARDSVENPSVEDADLLKRAIQQLPRRQRAAVALRYLNDWDANDAATFMGVTKPAYDQLLFRARRRLQTEYRRLVEEMSAGVVAGSAWLRAASRRTSARLRALGAENGAVGDLASVSVSQLAAGALAFALTVGGTATPARPTHMAGGGSFGHRRPTAMAGAAQRARSARAHEATGSRVAASGGGAVAAVGRQRPPQVTSNRSLWNQMTAEDVDQPEDTHITSISLTSDFSANGTGYAAGRATCPNTLCPAVLFTTTDGGATWMRLPGAGFDSETLLLPPAHGSGAQKLFAMGRLGLQVSEDGGGSFHPAAPTGTGHVVGSASISPAFDSGDPSILIGAQTLMRYRDDLEVVEPSASTTGVGPLEPAFSPQYPADSRIVVGGLSQNPDAGRLTATVHTCSGSICSAAFLDDVAIVPDIRLAPDYAASNRAYAFTYRGLYRSVDGAATFEQVDGPWERGTVEDVWMGPEGMIAVAATGRDAGLYISGDDSRTWSRAANPVFEEGAKLVTATGRTIMVALPGAGLVCSSDAGATWAARCGR